MVANNIKFEIAEPVFIQFGGEALGLGEDEIDEHDYAEINFRICRTEARIKTKQTLFVRRLINSHWYRRQVTTQDISVNGAAIVMPFQMEVGAMLEVSTASGNFSAVAKVRHCFLTDEGNYVVGLFFINKIGKWFIS